MSERRFPEYPESILIYSKDRRRMAEAIEDEHAHLVRHALVDADADADRLTGIVLWGLAVTDATDGAGPKVKVAVGAALAPANAGDRAWRMVPVLAPITIALTAPGAGTRNDTIELDLTNAMEVPEQRQFRSVGPGGAVAIVTNQVNTMRRPTGALHALQGVDPNAVGGPAVTPGRVRLASVAITSAGEVTVTDRRAFLFGAAGEPDTAEGKYLRGVRAAWKHTRAALGVLLNPVTRKLRTTIPIDDGGDTPIEFDWPDGGFEPDAYLDIGLRQARVGEVRAQRGVRVGLGGAPGWSGTSDGLTVHGGTVIRAHCVVRPEYDGGVFDKSRWAGENIASVYRVSPGRYRIVVDDAAFGQTLNASQGAYSATVVPLARPNNDPGIGTGNEAVYEITYSTVNANEIEVRSWRRSDGNVIDAPFRLDVQGPIPGAYADVTVA